LRGPGTRPKGPSVIKRSLPLSVLLLVLGFSLAACGGSESDEDKVVDVIEKSAGSTDPADCERLATQKFLEQVELSQGAEAVKSCEENAKDDDEEAEEVEVSNVEVVGSTATAKVAITGGGFDGQTAEMKAVEEDGDWKVDEITKFVEFDQEKLADSLEKGLTEGTDALEAQLAECFAGVMRDVPESEAEEIILGGSPKPITEIIEGCQQGFEGAQ
jgi:hypothetical protein